MAKKNKKPKAKTAPALPQEQHASRHPPEDLAVSLSAQAAFQKLFPLDDYTVMLDDLVAEQEKLEQTQPVAAMLSDPRAVELVLDHRRTLLKLQLLHKQATRSPEKRHVLDAFAAIGLAGKLELSAPPWAIDMQQNAWGAKMGNPLGVDLNTSLGFIGAGKGKTSEAERRIRENIAYESRLRIWGLTLLDVPVTEACAMEAARLQQLPAGWDRSGYGVEPDLHSRLTDPWYREQELHNKRLAYSKQLGKDFYRWRTEFEADDESPAKRYFLTCLQNTKAEFLAQFPPLD